EAKGRNIFTQPHKEFLQAFLGRCDMVKFAQVQPPTEEKEIEVRRVRVFLDETIREEESA
ncbi:MAG: hypothetical protein VX278_02025, partial [Myxococcota bacterium]|nr:hypothetical protein [Myxococcota bacterium]